MVFNVFFILVDFKKIKIVISYEIIMLCILFGCNEFVLIFCFFIYNFYFNIIYINLKVLYFVVDYFVRNVVELN